MPAFGTHAAIDLGDAKVLAALACIAVGPSIVAGCCWGLGVSVAERTIAAFFSNLSAPLAERRCGDNAPR